MRRLSDAEMLALCESGRAATPSWRAWSLLAAASPDDDVRALGDLTPGQRDRAVLTLRRLTFGDSLECVARCPECREPLEFTLDAGGLFPEAASTPAALPPLAIAGYRLHLRLPTVRELADLGPAGATDLRAACVLSAEHGGHTLRANEVPNEHLAAIDEHLNAADPDANVQLAQRCPACGHRWSDAFDIVAFFWSEIETWTTRVLRQVHVLARAYGWSERDVLRLSPVRRQLYMELLSA